MLNTVVSVEYQSKLTQGRNAEIVYDLLAFRVFYSSMSLLFHVVIKYYYGRRLTQIWKIPHYIQSRPATVTFCCLVFDISQQ